MAHLVLVHGVGGVRPEDEWVTPLNLGLQFLGYDPVAAPSDSVTVVSYQVVETATTKREPPVTYVAPEEEERLKLELAYIARRAELERRVRIHADHGMGLGGVPFADGAPMARAAEYLKFPDVRLYSQRIATARDVWAQVLDQFPNEGHMIVVAHSLGSVVTADVLRRLPPAVTVDLLVTIGSPLAFQRYRKYSANLGSNFPYGRVHRWLNVYESNDLVTAGRGIAGAIPQALDVGADLGTTHKLKAYMSHPPSRKRLGS